MEPVHNTLSEDIRTRTVELLNRRLAAAIDLHSRLKQAHWNVWRPTFIAVHPLSDKVAGEGENYSDLIAERAAGLRGIADGAVRSRRSALSSSPIPRASRTKTIRHSRSLRRSGRLGSRPATRSDSPRTIDCTDMADLFTEMLRGVDHQVWFVESHAAPN